MRISMLALLPAAAVVTLAPRAGAQGEFHWKGKIALGKAIEIKGVNGDVRAVAAGDPLMKKSTKLMSKLVPASAITDAVPFSTTVGGATSRASCGGVRLVVENW